MPYNPGNRGHRGYKMQKVIAIEPQGEMVVVTLACGHIQQWTSPTNRTAEEWTKLLQEGESSIIIGKTRLRCEQCRTPGE